MRTELFGVPIDVLTMRETLERVRSAIVTKDRLHHVAMNVAKLVEIQRNQELRDDVVASDLIGIDGMGIVYALRMKGIEVPERVAGIDLMAAVLDMCASHGFKPYFLGAEPHVVARAAQIVKDRYPQINFAGIRDGYFTADDEEALIADIRDSGADCLFVGMPTPRKERFLAKYRAQLSVPFIMGVGGSFDVIAGKVTRAPVLMQKLGLEWFYRLYQEPRRMFHRYLRSNSIFALMLAKDGCAQAIKAATLGGIELSNGLSPVPAHANSPAAGFATAAPADGGRNGQEQPFLPFASNDLALATAPAAAMTATSSANGRDEFEERTGHIRYSYEMAADALMVLELLTIVVAAQIAQWIHGLGLAGTELRDTNYFIPSLLCAAIVGRQLRAHGILEHDAIIRRRQGTWRGMFRATLEGFMAIIAIAFLFRVSTEYSRTWLVIWFMLSVALLPLAREFSRRALHWLISTRELERRVSVISGGPCPERLIRTVADMPGLRLANIHQISPDDFPDNLGLADRSSDAADRILRVVANDEVDEVIIAGTGLSDDQLRRIAERVSVLPLDVSIHLSAFDEHPRGMRVEHVGLVNLLKISPRPLSRWNLMVKRLVDVTLSGLALLALGPFMLLIALLIKIDSPGPVLFRQRRNGYNEAAIQILKFRTMRHRRRREGYAPARPDDERFTRFGAFLRRTSLDELPQLINVFRGDMSLVGPRPHAVEHNALFRKAVGRYTARHSVLPGITGLAQINGLRGPAMTEDVMRERVRHDLAYIENWSLWLDMRILVLTVFLGWYHKNAF